MDSEKPNRRRDKKAHTDYVQRSIARDQSETITVLTHKHEDKHVRAANGDTFTSGVTYSLNKGRRWELQPEDFEPEEDKKVAVNHTEPHTRGRNRASRAVEAAFYDRAKNTPVDESSDSDDVDVHDNSGTSKKDRKHYKTRPAAPKNRQPHNSHSAETYEAGSSDVLVSVSEPNDVENIRSRGVYRDSYWSQRAHPPRAHKYSKNLQAEI